MGFLEKCHFDRLSSNIVSKCKSFECKNDADISMFFHDDFPDNYSDYQKEMMATTHCFYTEEEFPSMVCAFSLSSTALRVDYLPSNIRNRFNRTRRIPNNKRRAQYPAVLIGQLCVFDGFGRSVLPGADVGKEMMDLIKTMALNPENNIATRYLVVDATNNPKVLDYYKRNGFNFLFNSESDEYSYTHNQSFHGLKLFSCLKRKCDASKSLKTRLMYFDLIVLST